MFRDLIKDSFLLGIVCGIIISIVAYFTYVNFDVMMEGSGLIRVLYPPRLQLILLALSLVLFRFMMVRWNMLKTGRGLFFTLFLIMIIYFFNHRYKFF